jgi:hypothetical protein
MKERIRMRPLMESALALMAFGLGIISMIWRDWIEAIFGIDADRHSGVLEWAVVAGLFVFSFLIGLLASKEWRRGTALGSAEPVRP